MIKDFKTYIKESRLGRNLKNSFSGDLRKEDGRKITSCLGVDVVLQNINNDKLIPEILDKNGAYEVDIDKLVNHNYSSDELVNVRNFKAPYDYLIFEGRYGASLSVSFTSYNDVIDFELDDDFKDNVSEGDYIECCKAIATKMKEVGDCFEYIPSRNVFGLDEEDVSEYERDYHFLLVDESTTYNWTIENEEEDDYNYLFKECITSQFPELENEDFICWSYNGYGINIAIPFNLNNLINIKKYVVFANDWFNTKITESRLGRNLKTSFSDDVRKEDTLYYYGFINNGSLTVGDVLETDFTIKDNNKKYYDIVDTILDDSEECPEDEKDIPLLYVISSKFDKNKMTEIFDELFDTHEKGVKILDGYDDIVNYFYGKTKDGIDTMCKKYKINYSIFSND